MQNFSHVNPVAIHFGKGTIAKLSTLISPSHKVMIVYGGGSIKSNGVYKQVIAALGNIAHEEFGGIDKIKATNCTFVLAVGGGSVADAAKFICAAAKYTGDDAWDIILTVGQCCTGALPLGVVLTLPATGSEMNSGSVISRREYREKLFFFGVFPMFSILDPETTYTLPPHQTCNGVADAFCHVIEQYLTHDRDVPVQDSMAEGILRCLISQGPTLLSHPNDYEARANVMWACTCALNGWIKCGVAEDWATHMIGQELTAEYGLDHGVTLAIVGPALYRHQYHTKRQSLARMGRNVFNFNDDDVDVLAHKTIDAIERFYRDSLLIKTKLSEQTAVTDARAAPKIIASRFAKRLPNAAFGELGKIGVQQIEEILTLAV